MNEAHETQIVTDIETRETLETYEHDTIETR